MTSALNKPVAPPAARSCHNPRIGRMRPHMLKHLTCGLAMAAATITQASAQGAADIVELLCGRTVHYYSTAIGNQIEYTDPDGNAFLWHPFGEGSLVVGTWRLEFPDGSDVQVCYNYPDDAFGPATGGDHCFTYADMVDDVPPDGIRDGDPYGLTSGAAPFALPAWPQIPPAGLAEQYPDAPRGPGCAAYVS